MNHPDLPRSQGRHAGRSTVGGPESAEGVNPASPEQTSLEQVIGRLGPMSPQQAATVGLAVLDQLVAVHNRGMLHGDVRPGSVLLGPYDQIILAAPTLRSPAFTAPEGVTGPAADLWSLGATLYTAVEGRPPSPGGSLDNAGPIGPLLFGLLSGDPGRRPDPGTLRNTLLDLSRNRGSAHTSPPPVHTSPSPLHSPSPPVHTPLPPVRADVVPPPSPWALSTPFPAELPPLPGEFSSPRAEFPPAFPAPVPSPAPSASPSDPLGLSGVSGSRDSDVAGGASPSPHPSPSEHAPPSEYPPPSEHASPSEHAWPSEYPPLLEHPEYPGATAPVPHSFRPETAAPAPPFSPEAVTPLTPAPPLHSEASIPTSPFPSSEATASVPLPPTPLPPEATTPVPPDFHEWASQAQAQSSSAAAPAPVSQELVPVSTAARENGPADSASPPIPAGPTEPTEQSAGRPAGVLVPRSIVALTGGLLLAMAVTIGFLLAPTLGGGGVGDEAQGADPSGTKARFASAPRACGLLDDKQVEQVVPGFRSSEVEPSACDWLNQLDWRKPSTEKFDLRVRLVAQKQDASGIRRAREYLAGKRKDFLNNGKFASPKPAPPQDLKGVGEEAFSTGTYSNINLYGGSYKVTVVFRVSNLIAEVEYERGGVKEDPDGEIAQGAVKVARWLTQSLKSNG